MNKHNAKTTPRFDVFIWAIVAFILFAAVGANYYYVAYPWPIRTLGWILVLALSLGLVLLTAKGKKLKHFAGDAQIELRKVVWPTRQETVKTTLIIFVMVIVVGFLLWLADSIFLWVIGKLTV